MLLLEQDTTNNLYFNLKAYNFSFNNYLLLVLVNDMTKVEYSVVVSSKDTDSDLDYIYLIEMQTGTPDNLASEITLINTGYYTYQLYEQTNSTNLDKNDASVVKSLNFGKAYLKGDKEVEYTEHTDTTNITNYLYIKN